MSTHTPGPWTWNEDACVLKGESPCSVVLAIDLPQFMDPADKALIAVAPDYHEHAYALAMLVLQSDAYRADADVREQVDAVLAIHRKVEGR